MVGHIPRAIGVEKAYKNGFYSVEHFTGHDESFFDGNEDYKISLAKKNTIHQIPTMVPLSYFGRKGDKNYEAFASHPNWDYVSVQTKEVIMQALHDEAGRMIEQYGLTPSDIFDIYPFLLKKYHKAGVNRCTGTDVPFAFAGLGVHEEMQMFVTHGDFTPFEALKTATVNASILLDKTKTTGTIEEGKDADLVLLDKNPLENIQNTLSISGVMLRGKWFSRSDLDMLLDGVRKK